MINRPLCQKIILLILLLCDRKNTMFQILNFRGFLKYQSNLEPPYVIPWEPLEDNNLAHRVSLLLWNQNQEYTTPFWHINSFFCVLQRKYGYCTWKILYLLKNIFFWKTWNVFNYELNLQRLTFSNKNWMFLSVLSR